MDNPNKLSLNETKKKVLIASLSAQASRMDPFMRKIYDDTIEQTEAANDRIMLTEAQVNICKASLSHVQASSPDAKDMLDQLTLTRKAYAALHGLI